MHISWWVIEHFDKDFQRGTHFFPISKNDRDCALLVRTSLTVPTVELMITQQAICRARSPRSPLGIVAAQKRQCASTCAHVIRTVAFNHCLYSYLFKEIPKFQALNQTTTRTAQVDCSIRLVERGRAAGAELSSIGSGPRLYLPDGKDFAVELPNAVARFQVCG
jgi:hypothetical protein